MTHPTQKRKPVPINLIMEFRPEVYHDELVESHLCRHWRPSGDIDTLDRIIQYEDSGWPMWKAGEWLYVFRTNGG